MAGCMKKYLNWICLGFFLLFCIGTISFLHSFMKADSATQYLDWKQSVQIEPDGRESAVDYFATPENGDSFRFETVIPASDSFGQLLFETTGYRLTVLLNDSEIWTSEAALPENTVNQTQADIPLPLNTECRLVILCTVTDNSCIIFPPFPRVTSEHLMDAENYAYANLYGIPTGALAFVSLMVLGLFLLGILRRQTDYSLIPLFFAAGILTVFQITQGLGYCFLPQTLVRVFTGQWSKPVITALLLLYLFMNRKKSFWKYLGFAAVGSAVVLSVCYLISTLQEGYLSEYLNAEILALIESGHYSGLLYWLTVWLTAVCAVVSVYAVMHSFTAQQIETQSLRLKNQLILDSYRTIERKLYDSAGLRHEAKHMLTLLDAMYQKGDYEAIGSMLKEMKQQNDRIARTQFTENITINAILQDAAGRALQADIDFRAEAIVPEKLTVTENDLCRLLMNMLDNALEAAAKTDNKEKRFIHFKAEVKNGFLAIKCENSFDGKVIQDDHGYYRTTKDDAETHGFGLKLMAEVAEKYHSLLDIFLSDHGSFIVQTALKL